MRLSLGAVFLAVVLVSCQGPDPVLLFGPDTQDLKPAIQTWLTGHGLKWKTTDVWPASGPVVRLTTTPGWNLSTSSKPSALPADWNDGPYLPAGSLAELGRSGAAVPLWFDPWGSTIFAGQPPADWDAVQQHSGPLLAAGGQAAFRQMIFFLDAAPDASAFWFDSPSTSWTAGLKRLSERVRTPGWAGLWNFARGDVTARYPKGGNSIVLETYRDFETGSGGARRFYPLRLKTGSMAGIVVFAETWGDADGIKRAVPLVRVLASPDLQTAASTATHWLAVNIRAAELDGEGAVARRLANGARHFYPVSDRLPANLDGSGLATVIQLTVERTPKTR